MNDQAWTVEGAEVAEYHNTGYAQRAILATIVKLTKTQVVLENGHRYNRETLRQVGGRSELLPVTDDRVCRELDRGVYSAMTAKIDRIDRDVRNQRTDIYAALDAIEQAVREARNAMRGKEA